MVRRVEVAGTRVERKRRARSATLLSPCISKLVGLWLACLAAELGRGGGVARASWIDPDTLPEYRTKNFGGDSREFDLVFSDEFNRCVSGARVGGGWGRHMLEQTDKRNMRTTCVLLRAVHPGWTPQ